MRSMQLLRNGPAWVVEGLFNRIRLDGYSSNHKRVHRVYCEMKLNMKRRTRKRVIARLAQPRAYVVSNSPSLDRRSEGPSNQFIALRATL